MNLRAYAPCNDQIDRLLNEAVRKVGHPVSNWVPACNVWEESDRFCIELALPGWQTQDVNLEMENGTLTVKGQRRMENNEAGEKPKFFIREVLQNNFVRSFKLPANLEWNKAQASFTDGMLTVTFPKNEKAQPRRIMIQ